MRRLAAATALVLTLVAPVACSGGHPAASYQPPFVPFKIEVDTQGHARITAELEIVTPVGTFGVSNEVGGLGQDQKVKSQTTLLYVYTYLKGELTASVFEIRTGETLGFSVDGKARGTISNGRIELTADPGKHTVIDVYDPSSEQRGKAAPPPYTQLPPDWTINLPNPIGVQGWYADIDARAVQYGGKMSSSEADLMWSYGYGLWSFQSLGWGPAKTPSPEQCRILATSRATGKIKDTEVRKGQAFCIETSKGNVAWVRLVAIDPDEDDPGQAGKHSALICAFEARDGVV